MKPPRCSPAWAKSSRPNSGEREPAPGRPRKDNHLATLLAAQRKLVALQDLPTTKVRQVLLAVRTGHLAGYLKASGEFHRLASGKRGKSDVVALDLNALLALSQTQEHHHQNRGRGRSPSQSVSSSDRMLMQGNVTKVETDVFAHTIANQQALEIGALSPISHWRIDQPKQATPASNLGCSPGPEIGQKAHGEPDLP